MKTETFYLRNLHRTLLPLLFLLILNPLFSQRISELPAATYMGIGDLMPIVQNGVTKKLPFTGLTGSLHFLEDSLFFKYRCHKIKGASQWYFSGDTVFIDTCHISLPPYGQAGKDSLYFSYGCHSGETKWYFSSDTIFLDTCFLAGPGGVTELNDLSDVTLTEPDQGDILRLNETNQWINVPMPFYLAPAGVEDGEQGITSSDQVYDFVTGQGYLATEADSSVNNEGSLDVTEYGSAGATITSNTSDSPSITLKSLSSTLVIEPDNDTVNYTISGLLPAGSGGISIPFSVNSSSSLIDGYTYFIDQSGRTISNSESLRRTFIFKDCTIKGALCICAYNVGSASNENWSVYIRVNNTTDYLIETVSTSNQSSSVTCWRNDSLNISLSATDFYNIKVVCPSWANNPSGLFIYGIVYLE